MVTWNSSPAYIRMGVHLFGGTWSPRACSYTLRRASQDNEEYFSPGGVKAVKHNFYVDDCLISTGIEGAAIQPQFLAIPHIGDLTSAPATIDTGFKIVKGIGWGLGVAIGF